MNGQNVIFKTVPCSSIPYKRGRREYVINKRSKCYLADRLMFQYPYKRGRGEYATTNMESYQNNMYSSAMSCLRSQHGE